MWKWSFRRPNALNASIFPCCHRRQGQGHGTPYQSQFPTSKIKEETGLGTGLRNIRPRRWPFFGHKISVELQFHCFIQVLHNDKWYKQNFILSAPCHNNYLEFPLIISHVLFSLSDTHEETCGVGDMTIKCSWWRLTEETALGPMFEPLRYLPITFRGLLGQWLFDP